MLDWIQTKLKQKWRTSNSKFIKILQEQRHFCKGQSNKESLYLNINATLYFNINATKRKQYGNRHLKFLCYQPI